IDQPPPTATSVAKSLPGRTHRERKRSKLISLERRPSAELCFVSQKGPPQGRSFFLDRTALGHDTVSTLQLGLVQASIGRCMKFTRATALARQTDTGRDDNFLGVVLDAQPRDFLSQFFREHFRGREIPKIDHGKLFATNPSKEMRGWGKIRHLFTNKGQH